MKPLILNTKIYIRSPARLAKTFVIILTAINLKDISRRLSTVMIIRANNKRYGIISNQACTPLGIAARKLFIPEPSTGFVQSSANKSIKHTTIKNFFVSNPRHFYTNLVLDACESAIDMPEP